MCLGSPGRIELLLGLGSQRAVAHQEASGHRSRPQAGQQCGRVAAGDEARERARHLSAALRLDVLVGVEAGAGQANRQKGAP